MTDVAALEGIVMVLLSKCIALYYTATYMKIHIAFHITTVIFTHLMIQCIYFSTITTLN